MNLVTICNRGHKFIKDNDQPVCPICWPGKYNRLVDKYIASNPANIQQILNKLQHIIRNIVPAAKETISYGIPTFDLEGIHLVHFAAYKHHIGFFPTPSAILAFKKELTGYKTSKGTIQFPLSKPIPYDLIGKILQFRVNEVRKT